MLLLPDNPSMCEMVRKHGVLAIAIQYRLVPEHQEHFLWGCCGMFSLQSAALCLQPWCMQRKERALAMEM